MAATITYNVVEGVVAITAGIGASSAALIGFGLDSSIEVASAAAVAWQFSGRDPEAREHLMSMPCAPSPAVATHIPRRLAWYSPRSVW